MGALRTGGRPAVVLAAGLGSRLAAPGASSSAKPLLEVGGERLVNRTLRSLEIAGCSEVIIVLGHEADRLQREIEDCYTGILRLQFVFNPDFHLANGLSVLCARPYVAGEFVLTMADHVFGNETMELIREHHPPRDGATLCVDYKVERVFDLEDATKVQERDGLIQTIGKELMTYNCVDTGVFICTTGLMDALAEVRAQVGNASLSDGVQALASKGLMQVLDIGDGFWQNVDTPKMLAHANAMLYGRRRLRSLNG